MLTKLLLNYAACQRHLFNRSAPYSGGSRPSDKRGPGLPDPEIRQGAVSKKIFAALRASVWSKNKGGGQATQAPPLDPPLPWREEYFAIAMIHHVSNYSAKIFRSDLTDPYGCLLPRKDVFTYNSLD